MSERDEHPESTGYDPGEGRPLRSRRLLITMRVLVIVGIVALLLPGLVTTIALGSATASASCAAWVAYEAPDAIGSSARFEIFGAGFLGWECYTVGAFGGDRHIASLGLIPGDPRIPAPGLPAPSGTS
ncbi:MAG: hypothetical protein ACYCZY_05470 [Lacisediminihabitans sp.]